MVGGGPEGKALGEGGMYHRSASSGITGLPPAEAPCVGTVLGDAPSGRRHTVIQPRKLAVRGVEITPSQDGQDAGMAVTSASKPCLCIPPPPAPMDQLYTAPWTSSRQRRLSRRPAAMAATAAAAAAGPSRHRGAVGAAPTLHRLAGASSACSRAAAPVGPASPHGARLAIPPPPWTVPTLSPAPCPAASPQEATTPSGGRPVSRRCPPPLFPVRSDGVGGARGSAAACRKRYHRGDLSVLVNLPRRFMSQPRGAWPARALPGARLGLLARRERPARTGAH